jgi:hypothetical protein
LDALCVIPKNLPWPNSLLLCNLATHKLVSNFKLIALANCKLLNNKLVLVSKRLVCLLRTFNACCLLQVNRPRSVKVWQAFRLQINNDSWQLANNPRPLVNQLLVLLAPTTNVIWQEPVSKLQWANQPQA